MEAMYSTKTFTEVYESVEDFIEDYGKLGFPSTITSDNYKILYYLLYAKYGNSPIANADETQFKVKLQGIIWQFGPAWEAKLNIQDKLRNLSDDDLFKGTQAIYNHASNPGELESETTVDLPELKYIDNQSTTNYKKSKMDGYTQLWDLLVADVTSQFITKFKGLFKVIAVPTFLGYESEV